MFGCKRVNDLVVKRVNCLVVKRVNCLVVKRVNCLVVKHLIIQSIFIIYLFPAVSAWKSK